MCSEMASDQATANIYTVTCASCGKETLDVKEVYYDLPRFGRMVIVSMLCSKCGYRVSDSVSLENKGPKRSELRISRPADLSTKLIRSQTSRITVPELGLELHPGPKSEAFITNIEGLLERFLQVAEQLASSSEGEGRERAACLSREIRRAMEGDIPFTVIVEDEMGNSALIPPTQSVP